MTSLEGKIALVTGATHGMGRATAILLAKMGAKVAVADILRTPEEGGETVEMIKKEGGEAFFHQTDVSKASEVKKMISKTVEQYGRIDILHNNAGVRCIGPTIEKISEKFWDWGIDTNLKSVFFGIKYVIPTMKKQGGGSIINTASTFGVVGARGSTVYCASKGGIIALTKAAALELAQYKIRVNCVCPGSVQTGFGRRTKTLEMLAEEGITPPKRIDKDRRAEMLKRYPIGRTGIPEDVANAVLFLASEESSFITGSSLFVDGGYTAI